MYTHIYTQTHIHTYIYIVFVNLVEAQMLAHNYFVDYFIICLTIFGKCFSVTLDVFLSAVGYLPYFHLVFPF